MRPHEWIRSKLVSEGRDWAAKNYDRFLQETESEMSSETYSRKVRAIAREINERVAPRVSLDTQNPPGASTDVATLDDSLEYHEVDESRFDIQRVVHNTWGSESNPNRQTKVVLKPREQGELDPQDVADLFANISKDYTPPKPRSPKQVQTGRTLELALPDLHLGRAIYGQVTGGEDFTTEAAQALYLNAVSELTAGYDDGSFDAVLFPFGNDFFNVDNLTRSTTAGTPQHENEHPLRTWEMGFRVAVDAIYYAARLGPVHVPVIPGNHDQQTSFLIGLALEAWFRDTDRVIIDNGAGMHKAYGSGKWGVVWHHGKGLKPHDLAMLFADCYPDLWARTEFREVHQGHLHHTRAGELRGDSESNGVRVRLLPSLAPADEWTVTSGFRSVREAVAIVWDDLHGIDSMRYYHPRRLC